MLQRFAYYNENDPKIAAWLRELIKRRLIIDGVVDTRSIEDVVPHDIKEFKQCHFFAGIGGWPYALRLAGWPDDRAVWTGSCPCQPFSAAGKRKGTNDERHLWPAWFYLIELCRPSVIFGEQVASAPAWLDLVQDDLEGCDYAVGAICLPACSIGAPHIRQRLWFVAEPNGGDAGAKGIQRSGKHRQQPQNSCANRMADTELPERWSHIIDKTNNNHEIETGAKSTSRARKHSKPSDAWLNCDWLPCVDGKARPVESGTFPLAHGIPARMVRLRGYGNSIVPQVAAEFIKAYGKI